MAALMIDSELGPLIEPRLSLPKLRHKEHPGRPSASDRAALYGLLLVLRTGLRWNRLPAILGFGPGATCWRRLHAWQNAGVRGPRHELLRTKLREAGQIGLCDVAADSSLVRAVGAGEKLARTPLIARGLVPNITSLATQTAFPSARS